MSHLPMPLVIDAVALVLSVVVGRLTPNSYVERKLRMSTGLFAAFLAIRFALWLPVGQPFAEQVAPFASLGLLLGAVNFLVVVLVNPLRVNRVPERFPNIVQDAMVISLFMAGGVLVAGEKVFATSAVSAVVLGFALQDTFGNMFAGLAIQIERPFSVGHFIGVGAHRGRVTQITWRATRLETTSGTSVVIPNNVVSKEAIVNYSEPTPVTRITVDLRVTYDAAPNRVRRAVLDALAGEPGILSSPAPQVYVDSFADAVAVYRVRAWTDDILKEDRLRDRLHTLAYYALKREGIDLPSATPLLVHHAVAQDEAARLATLAGLLDGIDLLAPLGEAQRHRLAALVTERTYGDGESVVLQGAPGRSMFVVSDGAARVLIEPGDLEVARLETGKYFGEMSLLTGAPRSATVRAVGDARLLEITVDVFKWLVGDHPEVLHGISGVVAQRHVDLARQKDAAAAALVPQEEERSIFARISQFFGVAS